MLAAAMSEAVVTDAVVLRAVPYREADLVVTLYTASHGRLSAMARGARRSRRRFGAALELFTVSAVALRRRGASELWTLAEASLRDDFQVLAADVATLAHGSYGIELVRELTAAEQPDPHVLALLLALFAALREHGASPPVLRAFELRLLELLGVAPILDRCVACERTDALATGVVLDPERGGILCAGCAANARGAGIRPLSLDARLALLAFGRAETLTAAHALGVDQPGAREGRDAVVSLILGHVGKPLRSLQFFTKVATAQARRGR